MPRVKLSLVVALTAVVITLLSLNVGMLNGPGFWCWSWRRIDALAVYGLILPAAAPVLLAVWVDRWSRWGAIALLMLGCFGMKIASVVAQAQPHSLALITEIVENPLATSYYTDAAALNTLSLREWIALYPRSMRDLHLHSQSKPPGPILFWVLMINLFGYGGSTPLIGGLIVGALGTASIPATYLLVRQLLKDANAAFCAACFLSVCPGFVLFFPMLDPAYILLSSAMIGTWHAALTRDRRRWSILLGLVLAASCVMTFNVLVIGMFMTGLVFIATERPMKQRLLVAARHGGIAIASMIAALCLVWVLISYDPIETFKSAWVNQHQLLADNRAQRPYPQTVPWDLVDLALGTGWISILLAGFYFASRGKQRNELALSMLAAGQLVAVAALGLLQLETSRVWNFMFPLLLIPVSLELRTWPAGLRAAPYLCLVLLTAAVCQNLKLIY